MLDGLDNMGQSSQCNPCRLMDIRPLPYGLSRRSIHERISLIVIGVFLARNSCEEGQVARLLQTVLADLVKCIAYVDASDIRSPRIGCRPAASTQKSTRIDPMLDFDFQLRPRIVFGPNAIHRAGPLAKELGATRVLVVSDPGVLQAGIYEKGFRSLADTGLVALGFHDLKENPTTRHVQSGLAVAKQFRPDLIVGLGGGSSMDCAKGINFLYSCGGQIKDYWGVGKATGPMLPMIAIPTTAGTGSETQSFALISDEHTHVKMACGDPRASCRIAILDPTITLTQPHSVTALTGIDALTHALETFVCNKSNPMSQCFSREAWGLLVRGFPRVLQNPSDVEARGWMQLGACFAGMAIEASMLGAAHAMANPLTASFGTPHGQAVGMMMPHVIRFNDPSVSPRYDELARILCHHCPPTNDPSGSSAELIAATFTTWLTAAGLKTRLHELGGWTPPTATPGDVESQLIRLAEDAAKQWTGSFNPRSVSAPEFLSLYRAAL